MDPTDVQLPSCVHRARYSSTAAGSLLKDPTEWDLVLSYETVTVGPGVLSVSATDAAKFFPRLLCSMIYSRQPGTTHEPSPTQNSELLSLNQNWPLERIDWGQKTHPDCGWHHSMGRGLDSLEEEKGRKLAGDRWTTPIFCSLVQLWHKLFCSGT